MYFLNLRCIAILAPFKAKWICTRRNAKIYLFCLFLVAITYPAHSFFTYTTTTNPQGIRICTSAKTLWAAKYRPIVDLVVKSLLPTVVIFVCNMIIIGKLIQVKGKLGVFIYLFIYLFVNIRSIPQENCLEVLRD